MQEEEEEEEGSSARSPCVGTESKNDLELAVSRLISQQPSSRSAATRQIWLFGVFVSYSASIVENPCCAEDRHAER